MPDPSDPDLVRLRATVGAVRAPTTLHANVAAEVARTAPRRAVRRRLQSAGALAGAAAVAGAVVALLVPSDADDPAPRRAESPPSRVGERTPTVLAAARLAALAPQRGAPAVDARDEQVLRVAVDGVPFPRWDDDKHPWRAAGQRRDDLAGRTTRTVAYDSPRGTRLGYTIVSGAALPWPERSEVRRRRGLTVHLVRRGSRRVAVWRVRGRTCVISAPASVPAETLVELASSTKY